MAKPGLTLDTLTKESDQQSADEQHDQAERRLDGDKRAHDGGAHARARAAGLERGHGRDVRGAEGRGDAEERGRQRRQAGGHRQQLPVDAQVELDRVVRRGEHGDDGGAGDGGEEQAGDAGGAGDEGALD